MKFIVVGLGSMGRRRIRLLNKISNEFEIVGVDSKEERREQAAEEFSIKTMDDLQSALDSFNPDCAIISTSPASHNQIISDCLKSGCHVFTELNLIPDGYTENINLASTKNVVLFLSSTFLYRDEIKYICSKIDSSDKPMNYVYHVGQYLPDWHPWEAITDYFVGDKRTNGCRELFAIELPWIIKAFGNIKGYHSLSDRNTSLPIQYNDNYTLLIEHESGSKGLLAVDVISRKPVRNLEVYNENLYLTWDGSPSGLKFYDFDKKQEVPVSLYENVDKQEGYASFVIENAYQSELECFIAQVEGKAKAEYTFTEDLKTLTLIDEIEGIVQQ